MKTDHTLDYWKKREGLYKIEDLALMLTFKDLCRECKQKAKMNRFNFIVDKYQGDFRERNKAIYQMRLEGYTYKKVGEYFGLTKDTVSCIYKRVKKIERYGEIKMGEIMYARYKKNMKDACLFLRIAKAEYD